MAGRNTEADGAANELEFHVLTHYEPVWRVLQRPRLRPHVNRLLINTAISKVPARPNPLSTLAPYTSWSSLTDRSYDARHLPPRQIENLPPAEEVAELFVRRGEDTLCAKSTVTFAYFAQWFTDGFLRSDRSVARDPRRNDATHEIDLLPIYGVRPSWTEQLRAHEGGRLKSQRIDGAEFAPFLCENGETKPEFSEIKVVRPEQIPPERRDELFAAGSDTMNSQIGFVLMNTLFLREHNRIAASLEHENPGWDDERLFQTARNILIVLLIKLVIEEYINHIAPYHFKLVADPKPFKNEPWYRTNWMAIEFNLLYRWHGLIPSEIHGEPIWKTVFNPKLVVERGLAPLFDAASHQRAGRIGLRNTAPALREVEHNSILQSRAVGARPVQRLSRAGRLPARHQLRPDLERRRDRGRPARPLRPRRPDRVLPGPVRRGRPAQLGAAVADRASGRRRRVLAGADQPAAVAARVQRADVLTAGDGDHRDDQLAL